MLTKLAEQVQATRIWGTHSSHIGKREIFALQASAGAF